MIAGFIKPDEGNIHLGGIIANDIPVNKRGTSIVFQSLALFPHLNIMKNIEFGLRMRGVPRKVRRTKVNAMIEQMKLSDVAQRLPEELSQGQQQRTALAKSIIVEPRVLLLDEPLSNIDTTLKSKILLDLKRLHNNLELTFIHVTHDPEEAMANADRILLMNKGKIEQLDTPTNIFNCPRNRFVAEFFQNSNIINGEVKSTQDGIVVVQNEIGIFKTLGRGSEPSVGQSVSIVIRHDKAQIDQGDEAINSLAGVVIGVNIIGAVNTYTLQLSGEDTFKFQTHMSVETQQMEPNSTVSVSWDIEDSTLLL
jgi:ABC-type Fe3+/spermidine/putrescine transport system ATPase subunit